MTSTGIRRSLAVFAAALAAAAVTATPAGAEYDPAAAIDVATARVDAANQLSATTTAQVSLSATARQPSYLSDARHGQLGAALVGAAPVSGQPVADGTVFRDVLPSTDAGVERTPSGLRLLAVAKDANAPAEYRFALSLPAGTSLTPRANGSVDIVDQAGSVLGSINRAWAFDAGGRAVPTHYTVEGTTLVQHLDHRGAAYPVVADPSIDFGLTSAVITLNPKDQRIILSGGGVAAGGLLGALICSGSGPGAALCAVGGAVIGEIVFEAIKEYAVKDNCDLEVTISYVPPRVTNVEQVCH